jgi:hypothetical protein
VRDSHVSQIRLWRVVLSCFVLVMPPVRPKRYS